VARGAARIDGEALRDGDGVAITASATLTLDGDAGAEALLFDMPARRARNHG